MEICLVGGRRALCDLKRPSRLFYSCSRASLQDSLRPTSEVPPHQHSHASAPPAPLSGPIRRRRTENGYTHHSTPPKPRISRFDPHQTHNIRPKHFQDRNGLDPVLKARLKAFAQFQPRSVYFQVLAALGLIGPVPSGPPNNRPRSQSWISQIQPMAQKYAQLGISGIDNYRNQAQIIELRDLVSDLVNLTKTVSREMDEAVNRSIIAHFIPWAATEYRRCLGLRPPWLRFDPALQAQLDSITKMTDIRRPQDLYPEARRYKRQIHLHVGPTNSGKTHAALRALHAAHSGVYAGPLRLLAHEVFTRMNNGQIASDLAPRPCNLLTGEEQRVTSPSAGLTSCTVEMLSSHQFYDVVVIDEIQMIGDVYRGDAWTQAVLGVQAKEVHLCGEETVIDLIKSLAEMCGDQFILHRYQRLTPLKVSDHSLKGDLTKVQRGDCVVTFSRNNIYALKKSIQSIGNLRVGMAYGGLPPEVREKEAQMFNRGSEIEGDGAYDVLVGSDAIGMGLNLKIKRIIFESLHKFDGQSQIPLSTSQVKQIGGRAGRFGVLPTTARQVGDIDTAQPAANSIGEVLTLEENDMELLRKCMIAPFEPLTKAVIKAPFATIEGLARIAPYSVGYPTLLALRRTLTVTSPRFAIGDEQNAGLIAQALDGICGLSLSERDLFCSAPASPRSPVATSALQRWAKAHADRTEADLQEWIRHENLEASIGIIESARQEPLALDSTTSQRGPERSSSKLEKIHHETLLRLESLHKCLVLYLWLGFRLPETFPHMQLCDEYKNRCEEALGLGLRL